MTHETEKLNEETSLFGFWPIAHNIAAVLLLVTLYFFIQKWNVFISERFYVYWAIKILIAYNILAAATRSLLSPILTLIIGLLSLFTSTAYAFNLMTSAESWQLIMMALLGFLISILLKL